MTHQNVKFNTATLCFGHGLVFWVLFWGFFWVLKLNSWMLSETALFVFNSLQLWITSLILCTALIGIHIKVVSFLLLHQTIELLNVNNAPWEGRENTFLSSRKSEQNCNILCIWRQNNIKKNCWKGTCQIPNTKFKLSG